MTLERFATLGGSGKRKLESERQNATRAAMAWLGPDSLGQQATECVCQGLVRLLQLLLRKHRLLSNRVALDFQDLSSICIGGGVSAFLYKLMMPVCLY